MVPSQLKARSGLTGTARSSRFRRRRRTGPAVGRPGGAGHGAARVVRATSWQPPAPSHWPSWPQVDWRCRPCADTGRIGAAGGNAPCRCPPPRDATAHARPAAREPAAVAVRAVAGRALVVAGACHAGQRARDAVAADARAVIRRDAIAVAVARGGAAARLAEVGRAVLRGGAAAGAGARAAARRACRRPSWRRRRAGAHGWCWRPARTRPAPSHVPGEPAGRGGRALAGRARTGRPPMFAQVPAAFRLQDWQVPHAAVEQQTPSTQLPLVHSLPAPHTAPRPSSGLQLPPVPGAVVAG